MFATHSIQAVNLLKKKIKEVGIMEQNQFTIYHRSFLNGHLPNKNFVFDLSSVLILPIDFNDMSICLMLFYA